MHTLGSLLLLVAATVFLRTWWVRERRGDSLTCLLPQREFRKVWRGLGVAVTKEEAHHFFLKYGCDQERRMPYNVFVQTLFGSQARLLGLTQVTS